jgi:hypothetical protein
MMRRITVSPEKLMSMRCIVPQHDSARQRRCRQP